MRGLFIHIFYRGFRLLQALIDFRSLLYDNRIPRPHIFLRFLQQAQAAVLLNILYGCAAVLQAPDALHPVDGFLVEYTAVAAVPLAGQQPLIRIKAQRVLRHAEHFRHLLDRIAHGRPSIKIFLDFVLHELVK